MGLQTRSFVCGRVKILALLATYNEERFVEACISHLVRQGIEVYLVDNESTDRTVELAQAFRGRGLVGIETLPRNGMFSLRTQLRRKEALAASLEADWFLHVDADEMHLSPDPRKTVRDELEDADARGFSAVNFLEFSFVATREEPCHDLPDFARTMRHYYPYAPASPHRLNAWKKQNVPVDLASTGGHVVHFPDLRMSPRTLWMKHYLYLSIEHALEKFVRRRFDPAEVSDGWYGFRPLLTADTLRLPSNADTRFMAEDNVLDASAPRRTHLLDDAMREIMRLSRTGADSHA